MFSAFTKGIRQLSDPATRQVVLISIGIAILTFLFLFACMEALLSHTQVFETGWMETVSDIVARFGALVLTWLLFPAAISAVVGLYLERVASAVEARHYPDLAQAPEQPFTEALTAAAKFLAAMVAMNMVLLLFIFAGPLYAILYYAANGYLISREFFELVSLRRLDAERTRALRKRRQTTLFMVGVIFAFMMTVPIVNLLTPIIATATMVHIFEAWRGAEGSALVTA